MSNQGVDFTQVYSYVNQKVGDLDSKVQDQFGQVHDEIRRLEEEIMEVRNSLAQLMAQVSQSFAQFQNTLQEIKTVGLDGNMMIDQGTKILSQDIHRSEQITQQGLSQVSSGVAIVDVLQALSEAAESGTAIARSVDEVKSRYDQALQAVSEKQQLFDGHFEEIQRGLQQQFRVIAAHIYEIIDGISKYLKELEFNLEEDEEIREYNLGAQQVTVRKRSQMLSEQKQRIDLDAIRRFIELQEHLKRFLADDSAVRLESADGAGLDQELPAVALPVNVVVMTPNAFIQGDGLQIYCLETGTSDCYSKQDPQKDFSELNECILKTASRLDLSQGKVLGAKGLQILKKSMRRLVEAGLLRSDHLKLIEEHLDTYPLIVMQP